MTPTEVTLRLEVLHRSTYQEDAWIACVVMAMLLGGWRGADAGSPEGARWHLGAWGRDQSAEGSLGGHIKVATPRAFIHGA